MSHRRSIRKTIISAIATLVAAGGITAVGAAPAMAGGATCSPPKLIDSGHAAKHHCKIKGGSAEIVYTFKCYSFPPGMTGHAAVTWKKTDTKTIKNPCRGASAYAISYTIA